MVIRDEGCGIADVEKAMQPFYSTGDGAERSGMGFCVMQTFMDAVEVDSAVDRGTTVTMRKYITGEAVSYTHLPAFPRDRAGYAGPWPIAAGKCAVHHRPVCA